MQQAFPAHFNISARARVPGWQSIVTWANTFRRTGSVEKRRSGERPIRSPQNMEAVRQSFLRSPRHSARKHAAALGMSDCSVRRILHDDLHFHPYKLAVVQELTERDFAARQHACEVFLETLPDDALVFFSEEAHFHLSGCVNKQNMCYWSDNNPRELHERPLHCEHVTVWCALSRVGIIGEENEVAVTVNSVCYVKMILDVMAVGDLWFQQDGATAHTVRTAMRDLREHFPGRLTSLRGDIKWLAHSSDIAPCDYFLWGYLKSLVYTDCPRTLAQLKENIRQAIANIPIAMLETVNRHFRIQANQCITNGGHHLLDTIFKTE
ncbi:hypothetical protein B7P43_G17108 [Cryptotermes secundus]|uniref:DUF4817 domain-containing protein n=1 Tax=Cryptotermes secundus TaxID=105785 RepID=A0A2J7Q3Z6_9NEOP|nr:hypothetical protein B7P43_G17108 [Cryptotermes secundus]